MQLHFVGKNIEITPAIKSFITEKFDVLASHFNKITKANVILHIEHITHIAEATVTIDGIEIHATAHNNDMYKSIDEVIEKLTTQLTKHKEKLIDSHR